MLLTGSQHVHTFLGGNDPRQSCSTMLKLYWSHNRTQAYLGMDHYFQLFFLGGGGWEHGTLGGRGGNTHHAFTISSLWGWPFSLIFWRVRTFSFTFIFFKTCPPPIQIIMIIWCPLAAVTDHTEHCTFLLVFMVGYTVVQIPGLSSKLKQMTHWKICSNFGV